MHAIEVLELATEVAERLGYHIRQEYLAGSGGGACEFGGKKWIFVDLALNTVEQIEQVIEALEADPDIHQTELPAPLTRLLSARRAA